MIKLGNRNNHHIIVNTLGVKVHTHHPNPQHLFLTLFISGKIHTLLVQIFRIIKTRLPYGCMALENRKRRLFTENS